MKIKIFKSISILAVILYYIVIIALFSIEGCKTQKPIKTIERKHIVSDQNQLIFLKFKAKSQKKTLMIELISKKIENGYLNPSSIQNDLYSNDRLRFIFIKKNGESIDTLDIKNPLNQTIEVFNKDGTIKSYTKTLNEIEFLVYFPYVSKMNSILIERVKNKKAKKITTIYLKN